jgi:hypothetical protein
MQKMNLFLEEGGVCLVDEEVQSEQKAVLKVCDFIVFS